jgi:uncharacterized protein YndB with AHSA1/START domain
MNDLRFELDVNAPPTPIFEALTRAPGVARLYFGSRLVSSFAPGAGYQYVGPLEDGSEVVHVEGEVLACEVPSLLRLTHRAGAHWRQGEKVWRSQVEYRLTPKAAGVTTVCVTQSNFEAGDPGYAHNLTGWPEFLGQLRAYVEGLG